MSMPKRPGMTIPLPGPLHAQGERLDPRVDRTRRAVMDAVGSLIANERIDSVSHQGVAEVSGVGRATLYRHWPTPADLL